MRIGNHSSAERPSADAHIASVPAADTRIAKYCSADAHTAAGPSADARIVNYVSAEASPANSPYVDVFKCLHAASADCKVSSAVKE